MVAWIRKPEVTGSIPVRSTLQVPTPVEVTR
jgi:hypothetical protein